MKIPEKRFERVSLAAKPTAMPMTPAEASHEVSGMLQARHTAVEKPADHENLEDHVEERQRLRFDPLDLVDPSAHNLKQDATDPHQRHSPHQRDKVLRIPSTK